MWISGVIIGEVIGANIKIESPIVITDILTLLSQAPSFVFEKSLIPDVFI